jgi:hypothetical protein
MLSKSQGTDEGFHVCVLRLQTVDQSFYVECLFGTATILKHKPARKRKDVWTCGLDVSCHCSKYTTQPRMRK